MIVVCAEKTNGQLQLLIILLIENQVNRYGISFANTNNLLIYKYK